MCRTWELYLGVVVVIDEINVVGGWCCCTHFLLLGLIYCVRTCLVLCRTWELSYLGVVVVAVGGGGAAAAADVVVVVVFFTYVFGKSIINR